jgi:hypothetical protein
MLCRRGLLKGRSLASKRPSTITLFVVHTPDLPKMVQDLGRLAFALPYICEQYPHPQDPPSSTNLAYVYIAVILQGDAC